MGAMTPVLYAFREREKIMDLFEIVCGARMNPSYFRVGGLAYDLPEGFIREVEEFLEMMPSRVDVYEALLTKNKIWMIRTKGVGVISDDEAVNLGLSGPSLRACGASWDIRKAEPYSGYENFDFEIAKGENGDVYDRYLVRIKEMRESLKITAQAIRDLPEGPINTEDPKVALPPKDKVHSSIDGLIRHFHIISEGFNVPAGEVYLSVESPRGELGYYIVSDGGAKPYRLKIRAPSYINLESLCTMVKGRMISDVIAVIGSLDIVLGEIDR
jgi:NADH-quinone oxidoreductase subunit D